LCSRDFNRRVKKNLPLVKKFVSILKFVRMTLSKLSKKENRKHTESINIDK
jgi:hypothetical protein